MATQATPLKDLYTNMAGLKQDFKVDWTETSKADWKVDWEETPVVVPPVTPAPTATPTPTV